MLVSRSWWILLLAMGPLVGVSFISAVRTYAEVSGLNGTSAGVGEALSPLIGVWAPTFSACELAAVFLLPFAAIRLLSGDRQSGSLKLEAQQGMLPAVRIGAKALVLLIGWLIVMLPPVSAILVWRSYGGAVYVPELLTLLFGHILNAGLTIALAMAAASVADHPSTAAIVTLSATIGTWIINFFGAVQGGSWERVASFTPAAMVAEFQHGLLRLDATLTALALIMLGLTMGAIWIRLGVSISRRVYESAALGLLGALIVFGCTFASPSWDLSESRNNSFPESDEEALRSIREPLRIEVHLAPEDPRRTDLEHSLSKLQRLMPKLKVRYISNTSIGLFEQTSAGYGEIWYTLGDRRMMSRVTTTDGVLEMIYSLAGIAPPQENEEEIFRGHPLAVAPSGAGILFYGVWPCLVLASAVLVRRRR